MINEGGAVEIDGNGTLMATKSAILNKNRNPNMTQEEAEEIFTKYLGVTNFIWLNGKAGLEMPESDIKTLYAATNKSGIKYMFVKLPLTKNNVTTEYGKKLDYQGSYVNYYIANTVVLVPNYNDVNDAVANALIQKLYPTRKVVGIDVRNLYANGGMIHCVTQQQPK